MDLGEIGWGGSGKERWRALVKVVINNRIA
jgi:hypothetical protein